MKHTIARLFVLVLMAVPALVNTQEPISIVTGKAVQVGSNARTGVMWTDGTVHDWKYLDQEIATKPAPKTAQDLQIEQLQQAIARLEAKQAQTRPQTDKEARQANGKAIKAVCTARGLKFSHAAVEADGKITVTCR